MKDDDRRIGFLRHLRLSLGPVGQAAGIFLLFAAVFLIPIFFLFKADKLGIWWTVLLVLYLSILCGIYWIILHRRRMLDLRGLMGSEAFYKAFPREKVWDDRLIRFRRWLDRVFHIS